MMITAVDENSLDAAAWIHARSWQESHKSFCAPAFVALHTPERQRKYLSDKIGCGAQVYLLADPEPVGIVSVTGSLIEDLYVLPECQNRGYGSMLLDFAVKKCAGMPTLWILNNNDGARRLYERYGFRPTGSVHALSEDLREIEFIFMTGENE